MKQRGALMDLRSLNVMRVIQEALHKKAVFELHVFYARQSVATGTMKILMTAGYSYLVAV